MPGKHKPKRFLALDWDARTLRIVDAKLTKTGARVIRILSANIGPEVDPKDPEQMGTHIRRVLDQEGLHVKHAVVDIPRDQAVLNTLTLPAVAPEEMPGMVEIQIAKELTFPINEAVIDFTVARDSHAGAMVEVLVAAVRTEVVQQYEETARHAGLKLDRIGFRPFACKIAIGELLKSAMPERVVFIDVRPTFTEVDVLRDGELAFSRAASVIVPGRPDQAPALTVVRTSDDDEVVEESVTADLTGSGVFRIDSAIDAVVAEVTRSLEAYRAGDPGARMDQVVIGGDVGIEESLARAIQKRLSVPTETYNPAVSFGWEPDEGAAAAAYAASLGLVLSQAEDARLHFDFLHPKKHVSQAKERLKKAPLVAAVVLLFVAATAVGFVQYVHPKRAALEAIHSDIEALEALERDNAKFMKVMAEIEAFDAGQLIWADVLHDVFDALAEQNLDNKEIVLSQIDMNQKDQRVVLQARAKSPHTGINVVNALTGYRVDGSKKARFKSVSTGGGSQSKGNTYPYALKVYVPVVKSSRPSGERGGATGGAKAEADEPEAEADETKKAEADGDKEGRPEAKAPPVGDVGNDGATGDKPDPKGP